jgi:pSer/pThr/pTyr-binding forkhead associated (FHA) protein
MAKLIIRDGDGIREVTLEEANSVGRSQSNQVQISDPLVSKQHCLIFADQSGNYSIKDLGSRTGPL